MRLFDLHCDTLFKATRRKCSLTDPRFELVLQSYSDFDNWCQCMAVWIPDYFSDESGMELFDNCCDKLRFESEFLSIPVADGGLGPARHQFLLTVENGKLLCNNIDNIYKLKKCGVRMMTLTWDAENSIGGGSEAQHLGLTEFGKRCIYAMEQTGIIIDISHASDKLFYDVASIASTPLVASHSDSRNICNHMRNLTDEQFCVVRDSGGLVGINFHKYFLNDNADSASLKDVLSHIEHFLSLQGENTVCIGSDFDGGSMPQDLKNSRCIPDLYESMLKIGYTEQLVQKIMYNNAHNFFSRF